MNTPKHTPGPWHVGGHIDPKYMMEGPGIAAHGAIIGQVNRQWPEHQSNAALISAAPELLGALRNFVATIDVSGGVAESGCGLSAPVADPEWCDLGDAYHQARAAIAKAEGRQ